jgi:NAD(P)-dependent dehydrogenase (short-subunit alcohol dehydrogenase family)
MSAITGKVAAVTGAGSGIGRALALGLARRSARLAVSDVDEAGLEGTAAAARALGAEVLTERLDVADRDAVVAHAETVAGHFGVVHQIYNNAGIAFSRLVLESDWEDYERVLGVNLWGVIHGTKAFLPHLVASGDGHVVNISSVNGFLSQPRMSHYCASKFAVRGFTESLGLELRQAGHPVRATVVHPGGIRTSIAANAVRSARERGLELTPADEARRRFMEEKVLKMDPAAAAETILEGVQAGRARVLVGHDAKAVDALVRVLPALHQRLFLAAERRLATGSAAR